MLASSSPPSPATLIALRLSGFNSKQSIRDYIFETYENFPILGWTYMLPRFWYTVTVFEVTKTDVWFAWGAAERVGRIAHKEWIRQAELKKIYRCKEVPWCDPSELRRLYFRVTADAN